MREWEILNHRRIKTSNQKVALIQLHTIKSLNNKYNLNGRNHQIYISINTEYLCSQFLHQKTQFGKLDWRGRSDNLLLTRHPPYCGKRLEEDLPS
jgi:hypothetical protein